MSKIKSITVPINKIVCNNGQIDGVKKNPRLCRDNKFLLLKKSIEAHPDMLEMRELLVYENGGKYVVIGGNMRLRACRELGFTEMPCKVIPKETRAEELEAYIIIDNGDFGEWDWDTLANEWDGKQLKEWGVDVPTWEQEQEDDGDKEKKENEQSLTLVIECTSEDELISLFTEMNDRGLNCKIK